MVKSQKNNPSGEMNYGLWNKCWKKKNGEKLEEQPQRGKAISTTLQWNAVCAIDTTVLRSIDNGTTQVGRQELSG